MYFLVWGQKPLKGEIQVSGSKNAATKMMLAALLADGKTILENFPQIGDTEITKKICELIGAKVKIKKNKAIIYSKIKNTNLFGLEKKNRLPILSLGMLLARKKEAKIPYPEGCKIGKRPVDIHLRALKKLGAEIKKVKNGFIAKTKGLKGALIKLKYPSVGATENIILASVLAKGKTIVKNAAVEPEIIDLIKMLQKMGAIISLGTKRTIFIEGVKKLQPTNHFILFDRNEAVSFACLALSSKKNKIFVKGAVHDYLITFLNAVKKIGGEFRIEKNGIWFFRDKELKPFNITTSPHPGFMTDWQQPFAVLLTQAKGVSFVHETVYDDRFGYLKDLNFMGANIKVFRKCKDQQCRFFNKNYFHFAKIVGKTPLKARKIEIPDLRAGMAHLIAALIARGKSTIERIEILDRGYEEIDKRLNQLGAKIERKNEKKVNNKSQIN